MSNRNIFAGNIPNVRIRARCSRLRPPWGGETVVELIASDHFSVSVVKRFVDKVQVHVPATASFEEIESQVGDHLHPSELAHIRKLWTDDSVDRKFETTPEGQRIYIEEN